jgi:hypothetical protein
MFDIAKHQMRLNLVIANATVQPNLGANLPDEIGYFSKKTDYKALLMNLAA